MKKARRSSEIKALVKSTIIGNLFAALVLSSLAILQPANASSDTSYGQGYNAGRNDALDGR
jgi:hypothetical protein